MDALLLVDVQNDFVPGGALAVPEGDRIVPVINQLQPRFDLIVATQDWHPANHGSFAANQPGHKIGELIDFNGLPQILWPAHCVQGMPGADFVQTLDRGRWAQIFQKGTDAEIDSYSGFFDNGHRKATGLAQFLRERRVTDLYVAGLATDYCIKFTALDAVTLGFQTWLIEDACRGVELNPGDVAKAIEDMRQASVKIVSSTNLPEIK
jgi:nicotinamidase/pyrazinamidase